MSTQPSFEFTVQPGQLWQLDGANYRIVTASRGKAKLLPIFGSLAFRYRATQELIEKGTLLNEDSEIPF